MSDDANRGRILRLKQGYNPNSSSIGTIVFAMPAALLASTVAFGAAAAYITSALSAGKGQRHGKKNHSDQEDDR
jgi:hypothetical protein